MSSILKALKKLEHEKSERIINSLKIDSDILRVTDSPRGFSPFALALLLLIVFGGGASVAFYFMKETKTEQATNKPQSVISVISPQTQVLPPVIKPETLPAEIVVVPSRREPSGDVLHNQKQKPVAAGKVADSIVRIPASIAVSGSAKQSKETDETAKQGLPAATTVPVLRVNGIAFQNSSADSMAIINGIPVSNGSIIEGVTVEEIRNDRVLFQHNGEKFEILQGQSNR